MTPGETSGGLEQLRDSIHDLPTIPESLARILQLLEDPNSGARDLAEVIRIDAPLSAKFLRLANSPLYKKSRTIGTIQDCVAVLGYRTVRQVALCVSVVSSLIQECERRGVVHAYRDVWRHSVAVGAVARHLAWLARHPDGDTLFTSGLLHDLGKFVLTLQHPQQYPRILTERRQRGVTLVSVEREHFGYDHAQAGAVLAETWNFPGQLVAAIGKHHVEDYPHRDVGIIALADYLANLLERTDTDLGFDQTLLDPGRVHQAAGFECEKIDAVLPDLRHAIEALSPLRHLD